MAGNTLELSVKADYRVEPESYRMSVIHVGRVLQAIDHQVILSGQSSQIQSFPSLEESRLVALVRIHKFFGINTAFDRPIGRNTELSGTLPALLQSISSHYGLFFSKANTRAVDKFQKYIIGESGTNDNPKNFYSICTTTDNPFVWLKTGQWIERVQQLTDDDPSLPFPVIESSFCKEQRSSHREAFNDCSYVQALVEIN